MKQIILLIVVLLLFSMPAFSQAHGGSNGSESFVIKTSGEGDAEILQALPSDEKMLSDAELGNAFQALGIIAQPGQDSFGLMFVNAQDEFQFDKQAGKPFVLFIGNNKISSSDIKVIKKEKVKKLKVEILTVKISREDFEKILLAENVLVVYGDINYDVADDNLKVFRSVKSQIDSNIAKRQNRDTQTQTQPTNNTGDVSVKGYYRRDGTYVRPYKRSRPKKN